MWLAIDLGFAVGTVLAVVGLYPRRADDHPLCRRCGFDLTGKSAGTTACGECGADLGRPRAVRVGHRVRRGGVLAIGLTLLVPTTIAAGVLCWRAVGRVGWLHYAPVKVLLWRAASVDPAESSPAMAELVTRSTGGRLSDRQWTAVANAGLAAQSDPARPWDNRWGDLIEQDHADGHLSDDQWRRYARGAWANVFSVRPRPVVRRGDPVPVEIRMRAGRVASWSVLRARISNVRPVWAGLPADPLSTRSAGQMVVDLMGHTPRAFTAGLLPFPPGALADGPQSIRVTAVIDVGFTEELQDTYADVRQVIATGRLDLPATLTVVDPGRPAVRDTAAANVADAVRRSLRVAPPQFSPEGFLCGNAMVWVTGPPVGLSFDVFFKSSDGPERWIGCLTCPSGTTTTGYVLGGWGDGLPPGTPYDVVFRSNPSLAARTVDGTQAWDGEVTLHGIAP